MADRPSISAALMRPSWSNARIVASSPSRPGGSWRFSKDAGELAAELDLGLATAPMLPVGDALDIPAPTLTSRCVPLILCLRLLGCSSWRGDGGCEP